MPKQRMLDLRREGLFALWQRMPERTRQEAVGLWARLIAQAAQASSKSKGPQKTGGGT